MSNFHSLKVVGRGSETELANSHVLLISAPEQKRDIDSILVQFWHIVDDFGTTLIQHLLNFLYLLGILS